MDDIPDFDSMTKVDISDLVTNDVVFYVHKESGDVGAGQVISKCGPSNPEGSFGHYPYHMVRVASHLVQISIELTESRHQVWRIEEEDE